MEYELKKGRFISNEDFEKSIKNGDLENLFSYLRENKTKYNLTIRYNKITLYSFGRKLDIIFNQKYKSYQLYFDLNNASECKIDLLDSIMNKISVYGFDISKYNAWKINHHKNNKMICNISFENIKKFKFDEVLETLYSIFYSYKDQRKEEAFKQEFTYTYDNLNNTYLVFDTEYEHSFDNRNEKKDAGKIVKADIIALKKEDDIYKPIFIELKENINASVNGTSSNIGDHIIDTLTFKRMYDNNEKERQRFIKYVKYNLKFKKEYGLLNIDNVDDLIKKISFEEAPTIMIVCGFDNDTEVNLRRRLKVKFETCDKYKNYRNWNNIIVIGRRSPKILLDKGIPLNKFLEDTEIKRK